MLRTWVTRLVSAFSVMLIGMGGGSLPVLDGVLFHFRGPATDTPGAHFEATSACHADGCAVRSTAQQVRLAPAIGTPEQLAPSYDLTPAPRLRPVLLSRIPSGQPLSRAPPPLG